MCSWSLYSLHMLPTFPFVVLDTETTGLQAGKNRIIEFASVRYEDGKQVDEYEQLISIEESIPPVIKVLTRITPDALEGKPEMSALKAEIANRIGPNTVIIGQNVGFDIDMLKGEGIDVSDRLWLDTSMLASLVFPELKSYSLAYMSKALNLNHSPVHRALGDVNATLELFERIWNRLAELPASMRQDIVDAYNQSTDSYKLLAEHLPAATATTEPQWYINAKNKQRVQTAIDDTSDSIMPTWQAEPGIKLIETPVTYDVLRHNVQQLAADETPTLLVVKNVETFLEFYNIPDGTRIIYPPFLLSEDSVVDSLIEQKNYTSDEASLVVKMKWYGREHQSDLSLHGDEKSLWLSRLSATQTSDTYRQQWQNLPKLSVVDHSQLLTLLSGKLGIEAGDVLPNNVRIIIDDASLLEDSTTKALGLHASIYHLRMGAGDHEELQRFIDAVELWIEQTRSDSDIRYLLPHELEGSTVRGLLERYDSINVDSLPPKVALNLYSLQQILLGEQMDNRIVWIERPADRDASLHSVPQHISELLDTLLYQQYATSLIVPMGSALTLGTISPSTATIETLVPVVKAPILGLDLAEGAKEFFTNPPAGKTIILTGSKRTIDQYFIRQTEKLEALGVTLLCQGYSGGRGRIQATYLSSEEPTILVVTPWFFEGVELPPDSIDRLILTSLPFDNPSHTVISVRSQAFDNAFTEYSMPRLEHRLYRLIRNFCRSRRGDGEVIISDSRLQTAGYRGRVIAYLQEILK